MNRKDREEIEKIIEDKMKIGEVVHFLQFKKLVATNITAKAKGVNTGKDKNNTGGDKDG